MARSLGIPLQVGFSGRGAGTPLPARPRIRRKVAKGLPLDPNLSRQIVSQMGLQGVVRRRRCRTMTPDANSALPHDLVKRDFKAERPNQLWVADFTYVAIWWRCSPRGVIHRSDRGSQCLSIRSSTRPWSGWTGSTTAGCTNPSGTFRLRISKCSTLGTKLGWPSWPDSNSGVSGFPVAVQAHTVSKSFLKSLSLIGISKGLRLPHGKLDRVMELLFLRDLLNQLEIDCVVDVGANRGQFSSELRGIGYGGKIVSFEPVRSEFEILAKKFQNDKNWIGHQIALGSADREMTITVPSLTVMSSLLEPTQSDIGARKEVVQVKRLDDILPSSIAKLGCTKVFLKMDTQGYDLEVFAGASGCVECIHGIQSELSVKPIYKNMPHYIEALGIYESAGFELFNLSVVNRVDSGGLLEMNCFMTRA